MKKDILKALPLRIAIWLITINCIIAISIMACKKDPQINLTGTWCTLVPLELYYFTEDGEFTQATRPGEEWTYDQRGGEIRFSGTSERTWKILYSLEDEFQVVEFETDTLTLYRK